MRRLFDLLVWSVGGVLAAVAVDNSTELAWDNTTEVPLDADAEYAFDPEIDSVNDNDNVAFTDGSCGASFKVGGIHSVEVLTSAWKENYLKQNHFECPLEIQIEGFNTYTGATGAARVCGIHPIHSDVDMAGMSTPFFAPQAEPTFNDWKLDCKFNSERQVILLTLGHAGIAVVVGSNGPAAQCIQHLGGSLSKEQLRWIYSSFSFQLLQQRGLSEQAVPFSDGNDNTHLWQELHPNCTDQEIQISWVHTEQNVMTLLDQRILISAGETLDSTRDSYHEFDTVDEALQYLKQNGTAIALLQLADLHSDLFHQDTEYLTPVAIRHSHDGRASSPQVEAIETNQYPLAHVMYLGVWNDPAILNLTAPFIHYGLSEEGDALLQQAGFWSTDDWEKMVMRTRLQVDGGIPIAQIEATCGPKYHNITIAGSSTVYPLVRIWSEIYRTGCPKVQIIADGRSYQNGTYFEDQKGGSIEGAARVCDVPEFGDPVNIGSMSRDWHDSEGRARSRTPYVYDCNAGDKTRSVVQVDVAKDGIALIMKKSGIADACNRLLGGFTVDQLRWIFSSYSEEQLTRTGWDPASVPNSDGDPNTHLWSELDSRCAPTEIVTAGGPFFEGTHILFREAVMRDIEGGEDIGTDRPAGGHFQALGSRLVSQVQLQTHAIAYIGSTYWHDHKEVLSVAAIRNSDGFYVTPSVESIGDGSYNPLTRTLFMNLENDIESLVDTVPLIRFGLSHPELVAVTGMAPLQGAHLEEMLNRVEAAAAGKYDRSSARSGRFTLFMAFSTALALVLVW